MPGFDAEKMIENTRRHKLLPFFFLSCLFVFSLLLNLKNNHFRLGLHLDEPVKVQSIQSGQHKFEHPMFLLDFVRGTNHFFKFRSPQQVAVLGRSCMAVAGAAAVLFCYFLFRMRAGLGDALIICFGIAVSPILVIHTHYLKEDILLLANCLLCLLIFFKWVDKPSYAKASLFGVAMGLAFSTHYKAGLLVIFYLLAPLVIPSLNKKLYFKHGLLAFAAAFCVFAFMDKDLFTNLNVFISGFRHELGHAVEGHDVNIYPIPSLFCFHLIKSLIPGMTLWVAALSVFFMAGALRRWKELDWRDRVLILYVFIFYFVVEISPLKPFPDYMRYVIPVVPILIYFSYQTLLKIIRQFQIGNSVKAIMIAVWILIPFSVTARLVYYLDKDTREEAIQWLIKQKQPAVYESSAGMFPYVKSVADLNIEEERQKGTVYFVASSFKYDRFFLPHLLIQKDEKNHARKQQYKRLFHNYTVIEFKPHFKSFAFSNPTIRIIDIRREKTEPVQTQAN